MKYIKHSKNALLSKINEFEKEKNRLKNENSILKTKVKVMEKTIRFIISRMTKEQRENLSDEVKEYLDERF